MHSMASGLAFFTIMERRASCAANGCKFVGNGSFAPGEQMVRHERGKFLEPEIGNLREHLAFARDAVGHDDVEGGDAVAGDEQEAVAEVEDFADFAAADFRNPGQIQI